MSGPLSRLRKSASEMDDNELRSNILEVRASRNTKKQVTKPVSAPSKIADVSNEALIAYAKSLGGEISDDRD